MQYFALDLFALCTNHGAVFSRFTHNRAMCQKYARYRAEMPHTGIFFQYERTSIYDIIKVILHFLLFEMQRFAKLCTTMHNYELECTDSTQSMNRAKCFGSLSPRIP
jgi:hypothetical protein